MQSVGMFGCPTKELKSELLVGKTLFQNTNIGSIHLAHRFHEYINLHELINIFNVYLKEFQKRGGILHSGVVVLYIGSNLDIFSYDNAQCIKEAGCLQQYLIEC